MPIKVLRANAKCGEVVLHRREQRAGRLQNAARFADLAGMIGAGFLDLVEELLVTGGGGHIGIGEARPYRIREAFFRWR